MVLWYARGRKSAAHLQQMSTTPSVNQLDVMNGKGMQCVCGSPDGDCFVVPR